jgi:hypothetical protein
VSDPPALANPPVPRDTKSLVARHYAATCVLCTLAGVIAFWPTRRHGFVHDDHSIVERNWIVNDPDVWYRFAVTSYWPPKYPGLRMSSDDTLYRPVTIGSLRLGRLLHGGSARGYHTTNVLLHALVCGLVAATALRCFASVPAALAVGLVFATHPVHAEAVAPIVGRSELLAALFAGLLLYRHARPATRRSTAARVRFHVVGAFVFAAAILSKEHAIFVWPAVLALDLLHRYRAPSHERPPLRGWLRTIARSHHLGLIFVATGLFLMRYWLFGFNVLRPSFTIPYWFDPLARAGLVASILTPFRLLWLSTRLLVDPSALSPLWGPLALVPAESLRAPDVWAGLVVAVALLVVIVLGARRRRAEAVWLLAAVLFLLVPLHVIHAARWPFAERWLYVPTFALAIALAGVARHLGRAAAILGACLALTLLPQTWSYAAAWADDASMGRAVLDKHPNHFLANQYYAHALNKSGRHEEALHAAAEMADRFPDAWQPYQLMADAYRALGNERRAEEATAAASERRVREWDTEK